MASSLPNDQEPSTPAKVPSVESDPAPRQAPFLFFASQGSIAGRTLRGLLSEHASTEPSDFQAATGKAAQVLSEAIHEAHGHAMGFRDGFIKATEQLTDSLVAVVVL